MLKRSANEALITETMWMIAEISANTIKTSADIGTNSLIFFII